MKKLYILIILFAASKVSADYTLTNGQFSATISSSTGAVTALTPVTGGQEVLSGRIAQVYVSNENYTEMASQIVTACTASSTIVTQISTNQVRVVRVTPRGTITTNYYATLNGLEWDVNVSKVSDALEGVSIVWFLPVAQAATNTFAPYQMSGVNSINTIITYEYETSLIIEESPEDGRKQIALPVAGLYSTTNAWGLAAMPDFAGHVTRMKFSFDKNDTLRTFAVAAVQLCLDPANSISTSKRLILSPTEADWRPILGAAYNTYPQFFAASEKARNADGAYTQSSNRVNGSGHQYLKDSRDVALSTIHYTLYRYGDFTPETEPWDSADREGIYSVYAIDQIKSAHNKDIPTLLYYSATFCDKNIADGNAVLTSCIAKDQSGNKRETTTGMTTWPGRNIYYMSPITGWTSHFLAELNNYMTMYPEADGIMCDGVGIFEYDYGHIDGVTVKNGIGGSEDSVICENLLQQTQQYLHNNDKIFMINGNTFHATRYVDISMQEFWDDALLAGAYTALDRPFIGWIWPTPSTGIEYEDRIQTALLAGAQYGPLDLLQEQVWDQSLVDQMLTAIEKYKPLFRELRGRKWVFDAGAYDAPTGYEGNLFYVGKYNKYVATIIKRSAKVLIGGTAVNNINVQIGVSDSSKVMSVKHYSADSADGSPTELTWGIVNSKKISVTVPQKTASVISVQLEPQNCEQVQALGYIYDTDLDKNCVINLKDFSGMAIDWLQETEYAADLRFQTPEPPIPPEPNILFLANYNDGLNASFAMGEDVIVPLGNNPGMYVGTTTGGQGRFESEAYYNDSESIWGQGDDRPYYNSQNNINYKKGTIALYARLTAQGALSGRGLTTFFETGKTYYGSGGAGMYMTVLAAPVYNTDPYRIYAGFRDTNSSKFFAIRTNDNVIEMPVGRWVFIAMTWEYDEIAQQMNAKLYARYPDIPGSAEYISGSSATGFMLDPAQLPDKMWVGMGYNGAGAGKNQIDQVVIYDYPMTLNEIEAIYSRTSEIVPLPEEEPDNTVSANLIANFENSLDADFSVAGAVAEISDPDNQIYIVEENSTLYNHATPNKCLVSEMQWNWSPVGNPHIAFSNANHSVLNPNKGSLTFWVSQTLPEGGYDYLYENIYNRVFFSASEADLDTRTIPASKLIILTTPPAWAPELLGSVRNVLIAVEDGNYNFMQLYNEAYYNQMPYGTWTFIGASWEYNESTHELDVDLYVRNPIKSYTSGSVYWEPETAGSDNIFVGSDNNGHHALPCKIDNLLINSQTMTEADFDREYANTIRYEWRPKDCDQNKELGLNYNGDFDGNCKVDLIDLDIFANDWLNDNNPLSGGMIPNWP